MSQKWWLPPPVCVCAESLSQELWRAFPRWRRRLTDGSVRKSPPCEPQSFMGREALKHPVTSSGWTRGLMDQSSPPNIDSYHFYTLLLSLQEFKKKKKKTKKKSSWFQERRRDHCQAMQRKQNDDNKDFFWNTSEGFQKETNFATRLNGNVNNCSLIYFYFIFLLLLLFSLLYLSLQR